MDEPDLHFLVVDAPFYAEITEELVSGAVQVLREAGATHDRITVPGVLEIPAAVAMAYLAEDDDAVDYDGYVLLGCVIRGETTHYDIVANESARAIMKLAVEEALAIGNGILTVENADQAWARARRDQKNKGGAAAAAALQMARLKRRLGA